MYQSIIELKNSGLHTNIFWGEAVDVFDFLIKKYPKSKVFSHQETGNDLTFKRDISLRRFFKDKDIPWREHQNNMVIRGLKNRNSWDARWIKEAKKEILLPPPLGNQVFLEDNPFELSEDLLSSLKQIDNTKALGGENVAHQLIHSFLTDKVEGYWGAISYPDKSRYYCSLIAPYLTYGNISIRQIYKACDEAKKNIKNKKSLEQFQARLKWHCHFIQKLEMEPSIEFQNLHPVYNDIRHKKDKKLIRAWTDGKTGYPLIDAAMRCVQQTGYLNFRLRATVVSFLTHLLWQPWQSGSGHLARMFLDYEPGIHFSQFQMQAGTTGINTIRIYNPIKQSKEKDKEGEFIKKWVPELKDLPTKFVHEPWLMSQMDSILYDFIPGETYPLPIVNFEESYKKAQDNLWKIKKAPHTKFISKSILKKHASRKSRRR